DEGAASAGDVLALVRRELEQACGKRAAKKDHSTNLLAEIDSGEDLVTDPYLDEQLSKGADDGEAGMLDDDEREHYERGWTYRVVVAARQMVVAVLAAPQINSDEPVAALILRSQPANVAALGALWADVLCSSPHKAGAIDALRRTLRALEHDK